MIIRLPTTLLQTTRTVIRARNSHEIRASNACKTESLLPGHTARRRKRSLNDIEGNHVSNSVSSFVGHALLPAVVVAVGRGGVITTLISFAAKVKRVKREKSGTLR